MTTGFNFERDILARCRDHRLTHVITALADGTVRVSEDGPLAAVQYLVFELAECDIRLYLSFSDKLEVAWMLRTLHQLAAGLDQLHRIQIAHQDLKPSNRAAI